MGNAHLQVASSPRKARMAKRVFTLIALYAGFIDRLDHAQQAVAIIPDGMAITRPVTPCDIRLPVCMRM